MNYHLNERWERFSHYQRHNDYINICFVHSVLFSLISVYLLHPNIDRLPFIITINYIRSSSFWCLSLKFFFRFAASFFVSFYLLVKFLQFYVCSRASYTCFCSFRSIWWWPVVFLPLLFYFYFYFCSEFYWAANKHWNDLLRSYRSSLIYYRWHNDYVYMYISEFILKCVLFEFLVFSLKMGRKS